MSAETRKKSGKPSLFKLFTVREPSSDALRQYEQTLRAQHNTHSGRLSGVGMAMVSASKLPPTVPKVNSKWEGVPDAVAERDRKARRSSLPLRSRPPSTATLRPSECSSRASSGLAPPECRSKRGSVLSFASVFPRSPGADASPAASLSPPVSPFAESFSHRPKSRPLVSRGGTDDGGRSVMSDASTLLNTPSSGGLSPATPLDDGAATTAAHQFPFPAAGPPGDGAKGTLRAAPTKGLGGEKNRGSARSTVK